MTPRERHRRRNVLREVNRLLTWRDKMYHLGYFMRKRSLRWGIRAGILTTAARLPEYLGGEGISGVVAVAIPVIVWNGLFFGGLLLQYIPSLISSRLMTTAQANDLNLMEVLKRGQARKHLEALWERVFEYEAALRFTPDERQAERRQLKTSIEVIRRTLCSLGEAEKRFLGLGSSGAPDQDANALLEALVAAHPVTDNLEKTREAFLISAACAITMPVSRAVQRRRVGFDIGLLLDWYDGAYFDATDVKLVEQFEGAAVLQRVRADLPRSRASGLVLAARRAQQRAWFSMICRVLAINLGASIAALNRRYDTTRFGAQALLWPGDEDEPWLGGLGGGNADVPPARESLLRERRAVVQRAFGDTFEDAQRMVDRMLGLNVECAWELRCQYDPEYCDGSLRQNAQDDVHLLNLSRRRRAVSLQRVERARGRAQAVAAFLRGYRPDLFVFENREALRAVRIAFHIDKNGCSNRFERACNTAMSHAEIADLLREDIDVAVGQREAYSERIMAVRLHHTLAILERAGYEWLVRALGYPGVGLALTRSPGLV